jgi:hypothetical protein
MHPAYPWDRRAGRKIGVYADIRIALKQRIGSGGKHLMDCSKAFEGFDKA